jgi:hypothetical protein
MAQSGTSLATRQSRSRMAPPPCPCPVHGRGTRAPATVADGDGAPGRDQGGSHAPAAACARAGVSLRGSGRARTPVVHPPARNLGAPPARLINREGGHVHQEHMRQQSAPIDAQIRRRSQHPCRRGSQSQKNQRAHMRMPWRWAGRVGSPVFGRDGLVRARIVPLPACARPFAAARRAAAVEPGRHPQLYRPTMY